MYVITLQDSTTTLTLPPLEVPLTTQPAVLSTDVTTLSNDIYTDTTGNYRRTGTHTWAYMTKAEYEALFDFWYRQTYVTFQYPRITITQLGISDMVARIEVSSQQIIDNCGDHQNITLSWRESLQNPVESS